MPLGFGLLKFLHKTSGSASIVSASPNYGSTGADRSIVITKTGGAAYTGSEAVTVGGVSCSVTAHTNNTLTVTVPSGGSEGLHDVVANSVTLSNGYLALAMTFWVDLARGVTLSGSNITAVADQAGSTSVATTWTASASNPTINASDAAFNGRPSMTLAKASNQYLDAGNVLPFGTGGNSASIVAAALSTNASGDTYAALCCLSLSTLYFNMALDATATGKLQFYTNTGPAVTNAAINDGVARGFIAIHDHALAGGTNELNVDGTLQTATGADTGVFGTTTESLGIGAALNGLGGKAFFWDGKASEVFGVQKALSTQEQAFLMAKSTVGSFANLNGVGA